MSTDATLLQFAAEVSLFLVAVAGLVLAARAGLVGRDRASRGLLAGGFGVLAVAAFAQGALVVDRVDDRGPLLVLRLCGAALIALGAIGWAAGRRGRALLGVGLVALVVAALVDRFGSTAAADVGLLVAAAAIGGSIVLAGRRSIPLRIGTSAAALLLMVVLAVSLAVSVVLTHNVEDEALRRYGSRTRAEAEAASDTGRGALITARVIGAVLSGDRTSDLLAFQPGATAAARSRARTDIAADLAVLTGNRLLGFDDPVVYVGPDGTPQAASPAHLDDLTRAGLADDDLIVDAQQTQGPRQGVSIVGNEAFGVAAVPLFVQPAGQPQRPAGVLAVAVHLDDSYLRVRSRVGEPLSFSLVAPAAVLASSGPQPAQDVLLAAAQRAVTGSTRSAGVVDGRFVVATAIGPDPAQSSPGELAFVTSVPTTVVDDAREALFRNLFLVVLAATLVSVGGAALLGERIGGGLRRLIAATERIRAGDLDARAGVRRDDELGVLAESFDQMAGSLRQMTGELRVAVADEARLRARLEAVVAGMGEALLACDRDRAVTECNRVAAELLGVDPLAVRGRPIDDVVRFTLTDRPVDTGLTAPERGVISYDGSIWTSGGLVPVHVTAGPVHRDDDEVHRDDEVAGSVFVLRDVRRERQAEQTKADLLATISHELRTPLTPIKGYADMIRTRDVGREQASRFAVEIAGGVDRLERVISQLVNFATVSGGPIDLDLEGVRVDDLVQGALDRARTATNGARRWHHEVTQGALEVQLDRERIDQALDELIDNAVKYSPPGSNITIGAEISGGNGSGPLLRLRVTDHGEGLDTDRLDELAGGFAQGDGSATRRVGGLGLGLALADRIARAHGGALTCRSTVGAGATFTIVVPTRVAAGTNGRHP